MNTQWIAHGQTTALWGPKAEFPFIITPQSLIPETVKLLQYKQHWKQTLHAALLVWANIFVNFGFKGPFHNLCVLANLLLENNLIFAFTISVIFILMKEENVCAVLNDRNDLDVHISQTAGQKSIILSTSFGHISVSSICQIIQQQYTPWHHIIR